MGYRGEDLDLRTPQTWSATPSDLAGYSQSDAAMGGIRGRSGVYAIPRNAPIWVDETVLASCNHAFDVALAHRSGEVRIEHLLHALTRIDGAVEVLERHGIRVSALRRDSATIIASELPVGLANGKATPRRSEDLEDVLRLAAAHAYRRNAPANVDDLMHVFLDVRPETPGVSLLLRHMARQHREIAEPPMMAQRIAYEPAYVPVAEAPRRMTVAPQAYYDPPPRGPNALASSTADTIQNSRLDALEQMVRALSSDLGNERKTFAGMLQQMQRDLHAQRDDSSRYSGGIFERMQAIEQLVTSNRGDGGMSSKLIDRIHGMESELERRMNDLSRTWSILSERMQSLENALHDRRGATVDMGPLVERLERLERSLAASQKSVEAQLVSRRESTVDFTPLTNRLDIIEEALLGQEGANNAEITEKLKRIEEAIAGNRSRAEQMNAAVNAEVRALASAQSAQAQAAERVQSTVQERVQSITSAVERQSAELSRQISTAIDGVVGNRMTTLVSQLDSQTAGNARQLADLSDRLNVLGGQLATAQQSAAENQKVHALELGEVHDALMKLNTNQHTLAGSIDQWRLDGQGDLAILGNRIDAIGKEVAKPLHMIETLAGNLETMHRYQVERYHRRNRFWYWLFGTDDWVAASWPSQLAKMEDERRQVKAVSR